MILPPRRRRQHVPQQYATFVTERQCNPEFDRDVEEMAKSCDCMLSTACGAGAGLMADIYPAIPVFPALNTMFVGVDVDVGLYEERCRTCGTCVMGDTGGICPVTRCSKGVLNGPCGGTEEDGSCELGRGNPLRVARHLHRLKAQGRLAEHPDRAPADGVGRSRSCGRWCSGATRGATRSRRRRRKVDEVGQQSREGALRGPLRRHGGAGPSPGVDLEYIEKKAELLRGAVDAVNVTDNQTAVVRMSSVAVSALLVRMGIEPVMQMVCRDSNRIAMQSDIFGAVALGIRNLTCLTGDHQSFGNQGGAKKVFDIDSVQLVAMVKRMRDERKILGSEEEIAGNVPMFIGAAANPFAKPYEFRALRLGKKVAAGVDYVQTQCIFDVPMFAEWMKAVRELGAAYEGARSSRGSPR